METEKQAPFAIAETRETYYRDDGTSFTRSDIFVKLAVNFRDSMLKRMKGPMLSVFLCIALHCDESRKSWPSLATIESETGYTHPAVLRALSGLESIGVIERKQRHNQNDGMASNEYSIKGFATMGVGNDVTRGWVTTLPGVGNDVTTKKKPYKKNHSEETEAANDAAQPSTLPGIEAHATKDKTPKALILAVAAVAKINMSLATTPQKAQVTQTAKLLYQRVKADEGQVAAFASWWYANDWRGKKGQPPTPAQIRESWQVYQESQKSAPAAYGMRVVQM